jgi:hypothetical protein
MPTIQIQLKEGEFVDAAKAASALSRASVRAGGLVLLVILAVLLWFWWTGYQREAFIGIAALVGTVVGGGVGRLLSIAANARRQFRQQQVLQRPYEFSWTDEAVTVTAEDGTSTVPWPKIHKRRETAQQFLLFLSDANFLMVPKRAFPEASLVREFRQLATDRVRSDLTR